MLLNIDHILLFCASSLLLASSPGPDILYVLSVGLTRGKKLSFACALGFTLSLTIHITFVACGIADLLARSPFLFSILKYLGAFYLFYLAIVFFKAKNLKISKNIPSSESFFLFFKRAFWVGLINPKLLVFFLSFFPQFINHQNRNSTLSVFFLGSIFMIITFLCFSITALISGKLHNFFKKKQIYLRIFNILAGTALLSIAVLITLSLY